LNKTSISYLTHTWNPVTGCSPVGPACDNCWARRMATRLHGRCGYPADEPFRVTCHHDRLDEKDLRARDKRIIGVCFMGDLFHPDVTDEFRDQVIARAEWFPQHVFMLLTKRSDNQNRYFNDLRTQKRIASICGDSTGESLEDGWRKWPLPNLWPGVSVSNQDDADERVTLLLQTPAAHRWVSYEPALGPVDFSWCLPLRCCSGQDCACQGMPINPPPYLDFIATGGETGPGARPAHPDCFRKVRDDCAAAGVKFHLKHLGKWYPRSQKSDGDRVGSGQFGVLTKDGRWHPDTTGWNERDIDPDTGEAYLISTPGRTAGRLLDGKLHDDLPE